jgi:hypothetical protein
MRLRSRAGMALSALTRLKRSFSRFGEKANMLIEGVVLAPVGAGPRVPFKRSAGGFLSAPAILFIGSSGFAVHNLGLF